MTIHWGAILAGDRAKAPPGKATAACGLIIDREQLPRMAQRLPDCPACLAIQRAWRSGCPACERCSRLDKRLMAMSEEIRQLRAAEEERYYE